MLLSMNDNPLSKCAAIRCAMPSASEHGGISTATANSSDQKKGGLRGKLNKVVLAYSGGLDTSVIVPWLRYIYSSCFNTNLYNPMFYINLTHANYAICLFD